MKILVLNCGSTSLKFRLFEVSEDLANFLSLSEGLVDRVGQPSASKLKYKACCGKEFIIQQPIENHLEAIQLCFQVLTDKEYGILDDINNIDAIAHKLAHGGEKFTDAVVINRQVLETMDEISDLAPLHNPPSINAIKICSQLLPKLPQVGVFETSLHIRSLPEYAYIYPLPYSWYETYGVRRYGFHSASHRYVIEQTAKLLMRPIEELKIISCHLGGGGSVCAIRYGKSLDISSGFTPQAGIVMATRGGDFDPSIIFYMNRKAKMSLKEIEAAILKDSGLLGICGYSEDMREIIDRAQEGDKRSQLAVDIFCYSVRKYIGAYLAVLNMADAIAFTGGIGERSPIIRSKICQDLYNLGIILDERRNNQELGEGIISSEASKVKVLVIRTDEELIVAKEAAKILGS